MKLTDMQIKDETYDYFDVSLELFVGKKIKCIRGSISDPFGTVPIFVLRRIDFEDGTNLHIDGEHDVPYLSTGKDEEFPMFNEDNMMNLWCEENPDECEDDLEDGENNEG